MSSLWRLGSMSIHGSELRYYHLSCRISRRNWGLHGLQPSAFRFDLTLPFVGAHEFIDLELRNHTKPPGRAYSTKYGRRVEVIMAAMMRSLSSFLDATRMSRRTGAPRLGRQHGVAALNDAQSNVFYHRLGTPRVPSGPAGSATAARIAG